MSAPPSPAVCPTPASVTTVDDPTEADGTVLPGVFTQVTWDLGDLGAAGVATIQYVTAIPLRSNTMTWSGATPPATGAQGANLDNNNGAETFDGEGLTTYVGSSGTYTGPPGPAGTEVSAKSQASVTAVDLAVLKSLSTSTVAPGQAVTVSLRYVTSEYRYSSPTVLTDTLPSGTCPVTTTTNYATDSAAAECAPSSSYADPSIPFSSVVENADGSFLVSWDLGTLPPDTDQTLTFTSLDRSTYIANGAPTVPVVAGDSLTDTSSISGTTNATCFTGTPTAPVPDPDCTGSPTTPIYPGENTPGNPTPLVLRHPDVRAAHSHQAGLGAADPDELWDGYLPGLRRSGLPPDVPGRGPICFRITSRRTRRGSRPATRSSTTCCRPTPPSCRPRPPRPTP